MEWRASSHIEWPSQIRQKRGMQGPAPLEKAKETRNRELDGISNRAEDLGGRLRIVYTINIQQLPSEQDSLVKN